MSDEFQVTEKALNEAQGKFKVWDKKGDGCCSQKDLGKVFKDLGLTVSDEKLKVWSDALDSDATGRVTWEMFKEMFVRKLKEDVDERELKEAFRVLDKGNQGCIDVKVLRWILKSLGDDLEDDDIEDMINDVDTDGSGTVDFEEFKSLMMSSD